MHREQLLCFLLALLASITVLHFTGLELYWYWVYPWFDLVTHSLFGLWMGLFILWGVFLSGYGGMRVFQKRRAFILVLILVGVIGVLWEVFEVWAGIPIKEGHALDTALDLTMDLVGACASYVIFISPWVHKA